MLAGALALAPALPAQPGPDGKDPKEKKDFFKKGFPFGPPGGFGGPKQQSRKLVKQFDRDGNGRLDAAERKEARAFLQKERATGGPKGGFGGRRGGGFAGFLSKPLQETLDTDKDGLLSQDEVAVGVKRFFTEADKTRSGKLDEKALAEGINSVFPQRPGFGPGGPKGGFGGPKGGPPGGGPPGGGPPGGGPRRFGPGNFMAGNVLKRAGADKGGSVTLKQLQTAATKLFQESDANRDGKLDAKEIGDALGKLTFRPGGFGRPREPTKPGPRVTPQDVKNFPKADLYAPDVLRTLFIEFENKDWEAELSDFRYTDVEVPVTLTVDGVQYPDVGVHFRGMSSYFGVPAGAKRSLNLSLDFAHPKQRLHGYKTLNLLNANGDPSLMRAALFSNIARQYIPAPKANLVKVVINGESWGIYVNAQQFNKDFLRDNFKTTKGARWKVKGSPGGAGGLEYLGENVEDYRKRYTLKSNENDKSWKALIELCKVLNKTPLDKLEKALEPILDIDGVLWFLALDCALINEDGYWTRASDFSIYRDPRGKFHIIPHDTNETFEAMGFGFGPPKGGPKGGFGGPKGGPGGFGPPKDGFGGPKGDPKGGFGGPKGGPKGGFGGPKGRGVELDPLVGLNDTRKPLRSRLLAVPSLKARYLEHVRTLAEKDLDWKNLGPVVQRYRELIADEVAKDTRKLSSLDAFRRATSDEPGKAGVGGGPGGISLRDFADQRRRYLLNHPALKQAN